MQIKVVDWMKGKTCGLCGKADGETMQEYRTPTGWIATTAVSFAHSWILPAENCRDATGKTKISDVIMASLLKNNILNLSGSLKSLLCYRVPYEAWIGAAGEAGKHASSELQVLLCRPCTALHAWVLPCAHHQRHCWLPLPSSWWVYKD